MAGGAVRALVERGPGATRAVVLDAAGALVEAHLERPGARPGDLWEARLLGVEPGHATVALGAEEARLEGPVPRLAVGALLRVEVVRAAMPGPARAKTARVRLVPMPAGPPGQASSRPPGAAPATGPGAPVAALRGPRVARDSPGAAMARAAPGALPAHPSGQSLASRNPASAPGAPIGADGSARPIVAGPDLLARLRARALAVEAVPPTGPDLLGAAGWDAALAEARLDAPIAFAGGELLAAMTEAGLVIDVDGHLPPGALALAAAPAVAGLLARHAHGGSVLVDFPSPAGRAARAQLDAALGAALAGALAGPVEKTAINGFGLVQIVLPRVRPSLIDLCAGAPAELAALELLRRALRVGGAGALTIHAAPAVAHWLAARPALVADTASLAGRAIGLRADAALSIWAGHVQPACP